MNLLTKIVSAVVLAVPALAMAFPIAASGTEGLKVLVGTSGDVVATFQGNSGTYSNDLYLVTDDGIAGNDVFIFNNLSSTIGAMVNLGSFAIGTELQFRLYVNNTADTFYTGPAIRNPDNAFHARVQEGWAAGTTLVSFEDLYGGPFDFNDLSFSFTNTVTTVPVPEPGSLILLGLGLASACAARRRRK